MIRAVQHAFLVFWLMMNCHGNHTKTITFKIAKNTGILGKMRYLLNRGTALSLYYTMIFPFIRYCNIIWACTHTKLLSIYHLQKHSVWTISSAGVRDHSTPLFNADTWIYHRRCLKQNKLAAPTEATQTDTCIQTHIYRWILC